jgi:hypothetical protein
MCVLITRPLRSCPSSRSCVGTAARIADASATWTRSQPVDPRLVRPMTRASRSAGPRHIEELTEPRPEVATTLPPSAAVARRSTTQGQVQMVCWIPVICVATHAVAMAVPLLEQGARPGEATIPRPAPGDAKAVARSLTMPTRSRHKGFRDRDRGAGDDGARVASHRRLPGPLDAEDVAVPHHDQRVPRHAAARWHCDQPCPGRGGDESVCS